jgi:hypothetical protein
MVLVAAIALAIAFWREASLITVGIIIVATWVGFLLRAGR